MANREMSIGLYQAGRDDFNDHHLFIHTFRTVNKVFKEADLWRETYKSAKRSGKSISGIWASIPKFPINLPGADVVKTTVAEIALDDRSNKTRHVWLKLHSECTSRRKVQ